MTGETMTGEAESAPTVIDVTLVSLRVSSSMISRALALLDDTERASASTRVGDARRRYLVAHAAARVVIGERLRVDPAELHIASEDRGRPLIEGVAFSLSHSAERAAVAIAASTARIGVDIERIRSRPHLDRLAQRVFRPDEYDSWRALAQSARPLAFARRWTEVEAVLKARGTGIAGGFASANEVAPGWSCTDIDAGAGYVGAVAADVTPIAVRTHALRLGDALTRRGETAR